MKFKKIMLTSLATFTLVGTLAVSQTIFADTASKPATTEGANTETGKDTTTTGKNRGKAAEAKKEDNKPEKVVSQHIEWRIEGGKKYLKINGRRATGWTEVDGKNYFFELEGYARVGLLETKETRYYFDKEGVQLLGWQKINDKDYYLMENGSKIKCVIK